MMVFICRDLGEGRVYRVKQWKAHKLNAIKMDMSNGIWMGMVGGKREKVKDMNK